MSNELKSIILFFSGPFIVGTVLELMWLLTKPRKPEP